jgi:methylmalonyl-CoA mutase cobalamin-binding subunit
MAIRCPKKTVIVLAGNVRSGGTAARLLAEKLQRLGIETCCLGREGDARRIARVAAEERADSIELCLAGGGVQLLRELLRELTAIGRPEVAIVVHRID